MAAKPSGKKPQLPTKEQILRFINESPTRVGKREIARAFRIKGAERAWLKSVLKELKNEGLVEHGRKRRLVRPGSLPSVTVVEVSHIDVDGELHAKPLSWDREEAPPPISVAPPRPGFPALGVGDRILARLERLENGSYSARAIRQIQAFPNRVLGVYHRVGRDGRVQPTDRRLKFEIAVDHANSADARPGEVVLTEIQPGRGAGPRRGRIIERLGTMGEARSISLIAIHTHGIPTDFGTEAIAEAEKARPVRLAGARVDLRDVPLVTIDPEDARDHDDAVWAAPDDDPANRGGWQVIVAIADVAHYVRPGSALDAEARKRGNSVYFPDRVVPMLPESLSAGLCSLKPGVGRPCLAVHMRFDADGRKLRHEFMRGVMRSAARLTYRQAQDAVDGRPDDVTGPLLEPILKPLYAAYEALTRERERRQPLNIDMPERRVVIGEDGFIAAVYPRERLDAHRLIEEFMIAANVCAAETCEALHQPCMYRIHEEPDPAKVEALREFLATLDIRLAKGQRIRPVLFNRVLKQVADTPHRHLVNQIVLRTQSQAHYGPNNLGHFGLALPRYAHFTSPIRRYADLLVHRAIVLGMKLGRDGLPPEAEAEFPSLGEQISVAERRAVSAERDALDRFTAAYMADRVGATFMGRISGVTRFGVFVQLDETGADGLVPISSLGEDYYDHDEAHHCLIGRHTGAVFRLGDRVEVRLREADPVTGGIRLEILRDEGLDPPPRRRSGKRPQPRQGKRRSTKSKPSKRTKK